MRDANGERVEDRGRKAHVGRQHRHAQPGERIPAEVVGQPDHQRHQRDDFLKDAEERAQRHEEKGDDQQQHVLAPAKGFDDARDDRLQDAAAVHHAESSAYQQDEQDDRDHFGQAVWGEQHLHRGGEPAPDGKIRARDGLERCGVDHLAPIQLHAGIAPRRDARVSAPPQPSSGQR